MYKLYGIPNCGSVKKARTYLEDHHIPYSFIDYKREPATAALIKDWMKQRSWEEIMNKKGTSFRNLTPEEKASITTAAAATPFILNNNSLLKRPIITKNDHIVAVGFDESTYRTIFNKN